MSQGFINDYDGVVRQVVQYKIATSSVSENTTSTTYVDTSLTASITPTSATNKILVVASGYVLVEHSNPGGTATSFRRAAYQLQRTTGTPAILTFTLFGSIFTSGASNLSGPHYGSCILTGSEIAGSTGLMTYVVQFKAQDANTRAYWALGTPSTIVIYELEV